MRSMPSLYLICAAKEMAGEKNQPGMFNRKHDILHALGAHRISQRVGLGVHHSDDPQTIAGDVEAANCYCIPELWRGAGQNAGDGHFTYVAADEVATFAVKPCALVGGVAADGHFAIAALHL